MVLGAQTAGVLRLVLRHAMILVAVGTGIGLLMTVAVTRVMSSMLFGVTPTDLTTLLTATAVLALVALLACYGPTRRATKVDPVEALRSE